MAAKDSFEPQTAFEGYIKAKLEGIEDRLDKLPCGETFGRLSQVENKISNFEGKATVMGAVAGIISSWVAKMLFWGK